MASCFANLHRVDALNGQLSTGGQPFMMPDQTYQSDQTRSDVASETDGAYDSSPEEPLSSTSSACRHLHSQVGDPVSSAAFGMASQDLRAASYNYSFCLASAAAFVFPPCLYLSAIWQRMNIITLKFSFGFRLAMTAWPMLLLAALLRKNIAPASENMALLAGQGDIRNSTAKGCVVPLAEVLFPAYYYVLVTIVFIVFYGLRHADSPLARRRRPLGVWQVHGSTPVSSDDPRMMEAMCVTWRPDDWDTFRKHVLPLPDQCPIVLKRLVCMSSTSGELTFKPGSSKQHEISEYRERVRPEFVRMWRLNALCLGLLQSLIFLACRWWSGVPIFGHYWSETFAIWLTTISSYILVSYFWFICFESYSVLCMQHNCVRNFTNLTGETCHQSIFDFSSPSDISRWLRLRALLYEYNHARLTRITGKVSIIVLAVIGMACVPIYELFLQRRTVIDVALVHLFIDIGLFGTYIITIIIMSLGQQYNFVQHSALLSMRRLELSLSAVSDQRSNALEKSQLLIDEVVGLLKKYQRFPRLIGIPITRRYLFFMFTIVICSLFSIFRLLTESPLRA